MILDRPKARTEGILVEGVDDEVVVYDEGGEGSRRTLSHRVGIIAFRFIR